MRSQFQQWWDGYSEADHKKMRRGFDRCLTSRQRDMVLMAVDKSMAGSTIARLVGVKQASVHTILKAASSRLSMYVKFGDDAFKAMRMPGALGRQVDRRGIEWE